MSNQIPLGKKSEYSGNYDKTLLFPIPRSNYRANISTPSTFGEDVWNCFEFSWLNESGRPEIGILQLTVPAASLNIVESKSLKLYLGSFANERFNSITKIIEILKGDLSSLLHSDNINVRILSASEWSRVCRIVEPVGECIDKLIKECSHFDYNPKILSSAKLEPKSSIIVYSELFRSLCPVTNQPDWATVTIEAEGGNWNFEKLGEYLVSFRNHGGFHEHCCETIFSDLKEHCEPNYLAVQCRFTRRGGIDINPLRTSDPKRRDTVLKASSPKITDFSRFARQ
jgi:7-cyano-7-deazaguanine reductase